MDLPQKIKSESVVYSNLVWNETEQMYEWTETQKFFTTQAEIDKFKIDQGNIKAAELVHNSTLVIALVDEELAWASQGEATKQ